MNSVLLLGPSLAAVSGVSTHLNQLFGSELANEFKLFHFQIGSEGRQESKLQKLCRFIFSPFLFAACIIKKKPDIVHLNTSLEPKSFWRDVAYLIVAKALGKHVVYQVHGGELPERFFNGNRLLTAFLRKLLTWPDEVVLLASVEYDAYRAFTACKQLSVIPNAIGLPETSEKSFDHDAIRLGFIGRLADNKGAFEAIHALSLLRKNGVNHLHFTIAGSGPSETELRSLVKSLALDDVVTFAGAVFGNEKDRFWQQTDIFVFPTYHREGLPYTVLESIAFGTPLVTTRVGGIPDVIEDGVHGMFVEPHDPAAVAAALKTLIGDRAKLKAMSTSCAARAREFYGVDRLARQFSTLYRSTLDSSPHYH